MNKKLLIIILAAIVILVFGGLYFYTTINANVKVEDTQTEEKVEPITAEELGLVVTPLDGGKKVKIEIKNTKDLKFIEYSLTYLTKGVEQAAYGEAEVEQGETIEEIIDLGTCSANVCRYDQDVTDAKLILKVTKTNEKIYQAEVPVELE